MLNSFAPFCEVLLCHMINFILSPVKFDERGQWERDHQLLKLKECHYYYVSQGTLQSTYRLCANGIHHCSYLTRIIGHFWCWCQPLKKLLELLPSLTSFSGTKLGITIRRPGEPGKFACRARSEHVKISAKTEPLIQQDVSDPEDHLSIHALQLVLYERCWMRLCLAW